MQKIRQPEATNEKLRPERFRDGVVNLQGKPSMDRLGLQPIKLLALEPFEIEH